MGSGVYHGIYLRDLGGTDTQVHLAPGIVVSFGKRNLDWVLDDVRRQRVHHANGRIETRLEASDSPDDGKPSPAEAGLRQKERIWRYWGLYPTSSSWWQTPVG